MSGKSQRQTAVCDYCKTELKVPISATKVPTHRHPDLPSSKCPGSGRPITTIR